MLLAQALFGAGVAVVIATGVIDWVFRMLRGAVRLGSEADF